MNDAMTPAELADCTRDVLALVTANMQQDRDGEAAVDPALLSLQVCRINDGESVKHWIERIATTLDLATAMAQSWLAMWAQARGAQPELLLRAFAQQWNSQDIPGSEQ